MTLPTMTLLFRSLRMPRMALFWMPAFLLTFVISACAGPNQTRDTIEKTLEIETYPDATHFRAIGHAHNISIAQNHAIYRLSLLFSDALAKANKEAKEGNMTLLDESELLKMASEAPQDIQGILIAEILSAALFPSVYQSPEDNVYYALAVLPKTPSNDYLTRAILTLDQRLAWLMEGIFETTPLPAVVRMTQGIGMSMVRKIFETHYQAQSGDARFESNNDRLIREIRNYFAQDASLRMQVESNSTELLGQLAPSIEEAFESYTIPLSTQNQGARYAAVIAIEEPTETLDFSDTIMLTLNIKDLRNDWTFTETMMLETDSPRSLETQTKHLIHQSLWQMFRPHHAPISFQSER